MVIPALEMVPDLLGHEQRIPGCQSTNHSECYGELWQCSSCGKVICYAEGTDDDPGLCDDSWVQAHCPELWGQSERQEHIEMTTIQQVVEQLADTHGVDLTSFAAYLWLELPGTNKAMIVAKANGQIISLAYCITEDGAGLVPEIEAVCAIMITGHWYVAEIRYSPEVWAEFIQYDARSEESFEEFAEWFGMKLKGEDWLTQAHLVFADWKK